MAQLSILIDLDRCVGCHSCTVACKMENNVPLGSYWNRVLQIGPTGKFPDLQMYFLPVLCQHCDKPACVGVCPTNASHKRDDGIVLIDKEKCVGCRYCTFACPYGVRYFNPEEGVVEKCTLCAHLVDAGDKPACVKTCVGKARYFGDLDDPNSDVSKLIQQAGKDVHTVVDIGNHPSVKYILRRQPWRSG